MINAGRGLEFFVLFLVVPLVVMWLGYQRVLVAALWIFASGALLYLRTTAGFRFQTEWNASAVNRQEIKRMLKWFVPACAGLILIATQLEHAKLFAFPLERTRLWALVMVLYPLLSVVSQELIYRSFFFARYRDLFATPKAMVVASAVIFAFAHVVLYNAVAVGLCLIGGWMFARTYARTRSLALVVIQHALYGCAVFTIGLGWYFYGGAR